jgi:hypothetical protein
MQTSNLTTFVRKFFPAHVEGGLSGGSSVFRSGSDDPHRRERKFIIIAQLFGVEYVEEEEIIAI